MHYRNGREAKNGDKIVSLQGGTVESVGVLQDATPGNDYCNGQICDCDPGKKCPCADCLCNVTYEAPLQVGRPPDLVSITNGQVHLTKPAKNSASLTELKPSREPPPGLIVPVAAKTVACNENEMALLAVKTAIAWLQHRTHGRMQRGVEGTMAN